MRFRLLLLNLGLAGMCAPWAAAAAADVTTPVAPATQPGSPTTRPATQPVDPAVRLLIFQLGDPDAAVREAASKKLRDMGKAALPALEQMADADDPEIRGRVQELVKQLQRRTPPGAPGDGPLWGRAQSVSVAVGPDGKTVKVDSNGQKITIREARNGSIEMTVSGERDGKAATETYRAKDADELKKENPEAYAIYEKFAGGGIAGWQVGGVGGGVRVQIGPGVQGNIQGGVQIGPGAIGGLRDGAANMDNIKEMIRRQMQDANLPPEAVKRMEEHLARIDQMQQRVLEQEADLMRRVEGLREQAEQRLRRVAPEEVPEKNAPDKADPGQPPELGPDAQDLGRQNQELRKQLEELRQREEKPE